MKHFVARFQFYVYGSSLSSQICRPRLLAVALYCYTSASDLSININVVSCQKQPPEVFNKKKVFLEISQKSQENTCARVSFFNKVAGLYKKNFIKKVTLAQVFSCEFCEISKNTFVAEHLLTTASIMSMSSRCGHKRLD